MRSARIINLCWRGILATTLLVQPGLSSHVAPRGNLNTRHLLHNASTKIQALWCVPDRRLVRVRFPATGSTTTATATLTTSTATTSWPTPATPWTTTSMARTSQARRTGTPHCLTPSVVAARTRSRHPACPDTPDGPLSLERLSAHASPPQPVDGRAVHPACQNLSTAKACMRRVG